MNQFSSQEANGTSVQELEFLVRAALFKPANQLVGVLLQQAAERIDKSYHPKPGEHYKGRHGLHIQCLFGFFEISRDYYYHEGKRQGHYPADDALGVEGNALGVEGNALGEGGHAGPAPPAA